MLIWYGPSLLNKKPIVVVATRQRPGIANTKTGDVWQTWILPAAVAPSTAIASGEDESVCGDCPLRKGEAGRRCYVHSGHLDNIYSAITRDSYPLIDEKGIDRFAGRMVRFGSYGDPAAVPFEVWESIADVASGWVGYTHQWRTCDQRLRRFLMASCDSERDRAHASRMGWRTFRTRLPEEELGELEIACPASAEGGKKSTCEQCGLCDGVVYTADPRRDISIIVHGAPGHVRAYERLRVLLWVDDQ